MRWNAAAAITTVLVVVLVVLAPLVAVGVLVTTAVVTIFLLKPKLAAGLSVVGILFGSSLTTITKFEAGGYIDEVFVLLPFVCFVGARILQRRPLRALPGGKWILLYVLIGAISSIINEVPAVLAGQSTFLMLKGFILAFAVAQLDWTPHDVRAMVKPAVWIVAICLVASVANFVAPEAWSNVFSRRTSGVDYRLGFASLIGPFDHEFAYGQFMALAATAIIAFRTNVRKGAGSAILLAGTLVGALLSFRRKAIAAVIAAMLTAQLLSPGKRRSTTATVIVVLPVALLVSWDSITSIVGFTYNEYFLNPTETARTLLYRDSITLAAAAFPFGVGFGRFGSFMAGENYSPEYLTLGYPNVYGLGLGERGLYLSDTFWPAIVGETGITGMIAFGFGLIALAKQGTKLAKSSEDPYLRWIGVVLVAWFVEYGIESFAAPVFNGPPLFSLLFGLAGVVAAISDQNSTLGVNGIRETKISDARIV